MAGRVSSPTFVGRRDELDRVEAALAAAREGHPGFVLLAGEAGVGKTRFIQETASRARAAGTMVLEGGCVQIGTDGLPFGPLVEALRGLVHVLPPTELDDLLGPGRAELARLMPQLERAGDESPGERPPDGSGQGRLFEHLLLFFGRLAERALVILVVEDVHWADQSTLDLLAFLSRNLRQERILVLVTYRSDELHRGHPLMRFLAEQERSGRADRIELRTFNRAELTNQLEGILGTQPDPDLVRRILARSEGNAFYAEELLSGASLGSLSETLREVLLARLATLSESTQAFVRVASAGGARVSPDLVGTITGTDPGGLEAALREAVARHVLVPSVGSEDERYAFRHALVQEAAYGDLLPAERTRLHSAFAQALADQVPSAADAPRAAELAYHWQAAHDLPRAFDAWMRAGIAAEAIYAYADARATFDRALELWDQVPDAGARAPLDRVELLVRAARAAEGPDPAGAVAYIRRAIAIVDPVAHPTRAGLLHERLGYYSWIVPDSATSLAAHEEAVRLVPAEPPSAARSWVLSGLGRHLAMTDRPAESAALCEEALAVAAVVGDRHLESRALRSLGLDQVLLGDADGGIATIRRARDVATELGDVHEVASAMCGLTEAMAFAGRLSEAAAAGLEAEAYASRNGLGARYGTLAVLQVSGVLDVLGRWDEATAALNRAERWELSGFNAFKRELGLLSLEARRGQFESAKRRATRVRLSSQTLFDYWIFSTLAELALWQGDAFVARAEIANAVVAFDARDTQIPITSLEAALALGLWAEADIAGRSRSSHDDAGLDESRAIGSALLRRMRAAMQDATVPHPNPTREAAWLATCEAEFSRLEDTPDPALWAAAAAAWNEVGRPYEKAYVLLREAEATLAQHRDRPRAARALTEAHGIATRLGALPLREAVEGIAARANIVLEPAAASAKAASRDTSDRPAATPSGTERRPAVTPRPRGRYELTGREREVLALLAAGYSDGEIAARLFISKSTASVHVASIKGKLGARSRVEIATDAIALGLVDAPPASST